MKLFFSQFKYWTAAAMTARDKGSPGRGPSSPAMVSPGGHRNHDDVTLPWSGQQRCDIVVVPHARTCLHCVQAPCHLAHGDEDCAGRLRSPWNQAEGSAMFSPSS